MIERLIIHNFKGIKSADIEFNAFKNILVGNNGVGKSTLMEALSLAMGYGLSKKYLESSTYREILKIMEEDAFQVYIMGHSCGNSDRTLLNTLFEHPNCVSIKPFYYINKDGRDNYIDIFQNISRCFTDMQLIRDRVVNKEYCEALA